MLLPIVIAQVGGFIGGFGAESRGEAKKMIEGVGTVLWVAGLVWGFTVLPTSHAIYSLMGSFFLEAWACL